MYLQLHQRLMQITILLANQLQSVRDGKAPAEAGLSVVPFICEFCPNPCPSVSTRGTEFHLSKPLQFVTSVTDFGSRPTERRRVVGLRSPAAEIRGLPWSQSRC